MNNEVYVCHKCGGTLTGNGGDDRLYGCECMSGYVRDWQVPSKDPVREQIEHTTRWIALFNRQGREPVESEHLFARLAKLGTQ